MNKCTVILILSMLLIFIQFDSSCAGIKNKVSDQANYDQSFEAQVRAKELYCEYLLMF